MARYDRIAPLALPLREQVFACWPVLLDGDTQARDPEQGRRVKLRFLALRPLARVVTQKDSLQRASLIRQIEAVNQELAQFPARDPERGVLRKFTQAMEVGEVDNIVAQATAVAEFLVEHAAPGAADEFARWALQLAHQWKRDVNIASATRVLARVQVAKGAAREALALAEQACELATTAADRAEWLRSVAVWAAAHRLNREDERARDVLIQSLRRAKDWRDERLVAIAYAHLCSDAADAEQFDMAVDYGWSALRSLEAGPLRTTVLGILGLALTRLELWQAAERCFGLTQVSGDALNRALASAGVALCAAHDQDHGRFADRRAAALRELGSVPTYQRARIQIILGRAAVLSGAVDLARDHVREALGLLGRAGPARLRQGAEEVLALLERHAAVQLEAPIAHPTDQVRRIAAELERGVESDSVAR